MWHSQFCYDERASEIDVDGMIPLLDVNFENVAHPLAVASIHDQNVGMLAMLLFHFIEESLQVSLFANITLMGRDCSACCLRTNFLYQTVQIGLVGAVCEGERGTIREKVAGARCSNTVRFVKKTLSDCFGE
jgi:hypothetical protein